MIKLKGGLSMKREYRFHASPVRAHGRHASKSVQTLVLMMLVAAGLMGFSTWLLTGEGPSAHPLCLYSALPSALAEAPLENMLAASSDERARLKDELATPSENADLARDVKRRIAALMVKAMERGNTMQLERDRKDRAEPFG